MNLLIQLEESMKLDRLQNASYDVVKNGFFSNYLAALLMMRMQDLKGLMIINDPANAKLTRFTNNMSDLNFWGKALFHSDDPQVKSRMMRAHADILHQEAGRIISSRILKTMHVPMQSPESVDWSDTTGALVLFKNRFQIRSSYFNNITSALLRWDTISQTARKKVINDSFMYLMQSDVKSALLPRMRNLTNSVMISAMDDIAMKIIGFKRLHEDGDGGGATGTANIASGDNSMSSNMIINPKGVSNPESPGATTSMDLGGLYRLAKMAPKQITKKGRFTIRDGKIVKRKVKGFNPRKFKAPSFMKTMPTGDQV